jgi:ornithine decarboxylase
VEQVLCALDPVFIGSSNEDMDEMVRDRIVSSKAEEAFYVMDVGAVLRLWRLFRKSMPRVHPFYAVKCNPERMLLSLLAALGAGFDVASKAELEVVESLGVGPDRIIFANPCKLPSHIAHAARRGVHLTTFDSESELRKLHKLNPSSAEAVLRIWVCDRGARCPLGVKYGAKMEECEHLLSVAKSIGVQVVGVAFHVGSGAADSTSFAAGICQAREVFDMAESLGMKPLRLLDIGGGFVSDGGHGGSFASAADSINEALEKHFPTSMGVCVIAEPGRFFAEEAFTLAAQVYGSRIRSHRRGTGEDVGEEDDGDGDGDGEEQLFEYWVNDGIYGSMNCLLYDHAVLSVRPLRISSDSDDSSNKEYYHEEKQGYGSLGKALARSTIFGPTCDSLDTILEGVMLPRLACGDWLIFPRMGAYTKAAASTFNGFDITDMKTVCVLSI